MPPTADEQVRKPSCFIAMPIATRDADAEFYGDPDHWQHVMESLFVKAVEAAGFEVIRPVALGAHLIHGQIVKHLSEADLVLCDLSRHNPNVFFELGVRTSLNRPVALVRDGHTELPFDTSGINTHTYDSRLRGWEIEDERNRLARHLVDSVDSCAGQNPLWRQFGLTIRAQEPDAKESPLEAKVDLLTDRLMMMQVRIEEERLLREQEQVQNLQWREMTKELRRPVASGRNDIYGGPAQRMTKFITSVDRYADEHDAVVDLINVSSDRPTAIVKGFADQGEEAVRYLRNLAYLHGIDLAIEVHGVAVPGNAVRNKRGSRPGKSASGPS